jgi:UDP-glucose 4-epimerase
MKIVVTGASGFVGRALVRLLSSDEHEVTGLIGTSTPPNGAERVVSVDLGADELSTEARDVLAGADAVAHLAAVRKDWGLSPDRARRINVDSGALLLRHARSASRFLFVSTLGVHGCTRGDVIDETSPLSPYDSYGASKVAAERAVKQAALQSGVPTTIVRPGIIYGPGDTYGMVTNMARLIARRRFLCVGSGANRIQLLHVADAAAGIRAALLRPQAADRTLLLAGSETLTLEELARAIGRRLGAWIPPLRVPERLARVAASLSERYAKVRGAHAEPFVTHSKLNLMTRHYVCDTSMASSVLDFRPAIPVERGLDETMTWLQTGGMRPDER